MCPLSELGLSLPTSVDLFVKSCVGFTIYFYCCLSLSSINSLNIIDEWSILFIFLFLPLCRCVPVGNLFKILFLNLLLSWWGAEFLDLKWMTLYVPTWEVLEEGNIGLLPTMFASFLLIPFRLQFIYSAYLRMVILFLQFLMPLIAFTGRSWVV